MANNLTIYPQYSPRLILVDAPDTEETMQDLVDDVRTWEHIPANLSFPKIIEATGKEPLGGGVLVGITVKLNNAKLGFAPRNSSVTTGTVTTPDATGLSLIDSGADFVTDGVIPGATIINFTDKSVATVLEVISGTEIVCLPLSDGTDNQFDSADEYKIWNIIQVEATGGNLTAVDDVGADISSIFPTAFTQVVRTSSSSATLSEQTDVQYASFNSGVTVDVTSSFTGTLFPTGTPRQPVNNIIDALLIAVERGFTTLFIKGDITLDTGDNVDGYTIVGENPDNSLITINPGASTVNSRFFQATIAGTLDGGSSLTNCHLNTLNFVDGSLHECQFNATITLSGANDMNAIDCFSGVVGSATPTIDFGGTGSGLILRDYTGGIELINKSGTEDVSIDLSSGQIILDPTITNGDIICRGVGKLINNAVGANVVEEILDSRNLNKTLFTGGQVFIDSTSSETGTAFPLGTNGRPVSSLADGLTIAANNGFTGISLTGFFTATGGEILDGMAITGGSGSSNVLVLAGTTTVASSFEKLIVTGAFDGLARIRDCVLGTTGLGGVTGMEGRVVNSIINHTDGVIQDATGAGTLFDNCSFIAPDDPQITINANGKGFSLRDCTGNILVTNKTDIEADQVHIIGACLEVAASCTTGTLTFTGDGTLVDNSAGTTIVDKLLNPSTVSAAVDEASIATAVWDKEICP